MTRDEHLLTIAAEECAELAQRLSKILRFGMQEVQPDERENPGQLTNRTRAILEFNDLMVAMQMLKMNVYVAGHQQAKRDKVEHFLEYSRQQGTLTE